MAFPAAIGFYTIFTKHIKEHNKEDVNKYIKSNNKIKTKLK